MLQAVWEQFQGLLGLGRDAGDMGAIQMALRTVFVYAFTLAIVRLGSKRFLSKATAFDVIVGIMLGSVMSRAITGAASFFPTLMVGVTLIAAHWLMAALAFRFDWFGSLVKGNSILLIEDGKIQGDGMRQAGLSEHDLKQALRMQNNHTDPAKIRRAYL
ncbi:MAG TPA: YetF domain-containing protein, partial [Pyrinomonadaceae bacterium]|nr:YetF domain-containing protein [Pyrinomonadaceae bacterium]